MQTMTCRQIGWAVLGLLAFGGCNSPYHADRGALAGGLGGAGVGALMGSAVGHTGAGAAIGAGVGTLAGAAIGSEMDQSEAQNRAMMEARLSQQAAAGSVTVQDVLGMQQAGVAPEVIATHIRTHGMAVPLQAQDLIALQQQRVPAAVVQAMQESPPRPLATRPMMVNQPPVLVQEYPYYWGPSYYRPMPCYHHYGPGVHWGIGVGR